MISISRPAQHAPQPFARQNHIVNYQSAYLFVIILFVFLKRQRIFAATPLLPGKIFDLEFVLSPYRCLSRSSCFASRFRRALLPILFVFVTDRFHFSFPIRRLQPQNERAVLFRRRDLIVPPLRRGAIPCPD
jgi:hypothetical protein